MISHKIGSLDRTGDTRRRVGFDLPPDVKRTLLTREERNVRSKLTAVAVAAAALLVVAPAGADLCTVEATPAATLLLPYFEVDIDDPNGVDTFFSINNASADAVLTHVILWGDWSVEALDFNVYLTGYDVQTIGMGLIIRNGVLPVTYFHDSVSPNGPYSNGHIPFPGCDALPYDTPALDPEFLEHLQSLLTGGPSDFYGGRCGGSDFGDNHARGYVTADVMYGCTLLTPCEDGYFHDGSGVPDTGLGAYYNVLWGDWYMVDYGNNFAQGDTLVHIEATLDRTAALELSDGSFWNRCTAPLGGAPFADMREQLATTFATRFYQNAAFTGGTDFLVWKDSQYPSGDDANDGYSCAAGPFWYPIPESQVVFFDEQENPETVCTISPCPQEDVLFPAETNRVAVADIDVSPESGWVYMNLNQNYDGPFSYVAQAWVTSIHSADGRFSAGLPAIQLDSFCDQSSILIGVPEDFPLSEPICNFFTGEGCLLGLAPGAKHWD
jgi:hypothetical protein